MRRVLIFARETATLDCHTHVVMTAISGRLEREREQEEVRVCHCYCQGCLSRRSSPALAGTPVRLSLSLSLRVITISRETGRKNRINCRSPPIVRRRKQG